ncbi:hypothetical protein KQX54_008121 [Cotesia glomerata]|uniref:Dipeptidylpeptidase IV N-terminal domain-containing protein n=1 Tax=Cotesia glomerata TaxID=32391 RepID=A0AAV7IZW4_COTGL|nr:hypothetical protein KQX54_008121 [Cotesia glomerata]
MGGTSNFLDIIDTILSPRRLVDFHDRVIGARNKSLITLCGWYAFREDTLLTKGNSTSLQLATWAPTGNALVFVHLNNIYYRPHAEKQKDYQITFDGVFRSVFNGIPDWVYEEEVFNSNKALWFSPSGNKMVFAHFDDTQTPIMNITYYGYPGSLSFQYTSTIPIHYPKPGITNPQMKLFYVDLGKVVETNGEIKLTEIESPPQLANSMKILAAVAFPTETLVSATWMNRIQNRAYFHLYDVENLLYNTAHSVEEKHGWVSQFDPPLFSHSASEFLLIEPRKQKDNEFWMHLLMVTNATTSSAVRELTFGSFTVTRIVGWDQDNSLVAISEFRGNCRNNSGERLLNFIHQHQRSVEISPSAMLMVILMIVFPMTLCECKG